MFLPLRTVKLPFKVAESVSDCYLYNNADGNVFLVELLLLLLSKWFFPHRILAGVCTTMPELAESVGVQAFPHPDAFLIVNLKEEDLPVNEGFVG